MFPDNAKNACFSPLVKHTDDKCSMTNFRLFSVLNNFSKIYEKIVKDFFINEMEHHFSLFISANRKYFSTELVLIRFLED